MFIMFHGSRKSVKSYHLQGSFPNSHPKKKTPFTAPKMPFEASDPEKKNIRPNPRKIAVFSLQNSGHPRHLPKEDGVTKPCQLRKEFDPREILELRPFPSPETNVGRWLGLFSGALPCEKFHECVKACFSQPLLSI